MRLKTFTGQSVAAVMSQVRGELGPDAIIVSTLNDGTAGARVIAAIDTEPEVQEAPVPATVATSPARESAPAASPHWRRIGPAPWIAAARAKVSPAAAERRATPLDPGSPVARALVAHRVPLALIDRLLADSPADAHALAARLATEFRFAGLGERGSRAPILLAGPPGGGKTLTAAKLAARVVMAGGKAHIVTTDTLNAGGIERLAAFARALQIGLDIADPPSELPRVLAAVRSATVIIDTPGANPLVAADLARIAETIAAADADACLVLPAGLDGEEAGETAGAFGAIGCGRLVATRLDAARRLGSILAAAAAGKLQLAEAGVAPLVADGLLTLTPELLAERLLARLPARHADAP